MENQSIIKFMGETTRYLEIYLNAPENTILFVEKSQLEEHHKIDYCNRVVEAGGHVCLVSFRSFWPYPYQGNRFLLDMAAKEICALFQDPSLYNSQGGWFYDYASHRKHTPRTLARSVYERVCQMTFLQMRSCLGIDLLDISYLAGMAYEKDAAVGSLVFYTGKPAASPEVSRILPYRRVKFSQKNKNFIRKQFAGVEEKGGLLFVREGTGRDQPYYYYGYVTEEFIKSAFVSIQMESRENWTLLIEGKPVFRVKSRDVFVLNDPFEQINREIDAELGDGTATKLQFVLRALKRQTHGSSVIFLDMGNPCAREMMENLERKGRALRVKDIAICKDGEGSPDALEKLIKNIARVDGALIWDYQAQQLIYVNVIIDGLALLPGEQAFGSRHNALASGIATLAQKDTSESTKAIAVIFSEDGGISSVSVSHCRQKLKEQAAQELRKQICKEVSKPVALCP